MQKDPGRQLVCIEVEICSSGGSLGALEMFNRAVIAGQASDSRTLCRNSTLKTTSELLISIQLPCIVNTMLTSTLARATRSIRPTSRAPTLYLRGSRNVSTLPENPHIVRTYPIPPSSAPLHTNRSRSSSTKTPSTPPKPSSRCSPQHHQRPNSP